MKRLWLLVMSLFVAFSALAQAADVRVLPLKEKRWAVVIGVDEYADKQIGKLDGAAQDAKTLSETLVKSANFPRDQVVVLATGEPDTRRPSRINIMTTVKSLAKKAEGGLLLIAFSGHGVERGEQPYLLPEDARIVDDLDLLGEATVPLSWIRERLQSSGVSQVLLLLDACRNDPGGRSTVVSRMTEAYTRALRFDNTKVSATATLYATGIGERAYEYDEKRQGYFTWAVVEGLHGAAANERGEVTLGSLIAYVKSAVAKQVAITGRDQHPISDIEGFDEQLVLAVGPPKVQTQLAPSIARQTPIAGDAEAGSDPRAMLEVKLWDTVMNMNTVAGYLEYERTFPNGTFVGVSRMMRGKLADTRAAARDDAEKAYLSGDFVTARGILQTAAIGGDPEAQARLASLDFLCLGVRCNNIEATQSLERAVQAGSRSAEGWLAMAWATRGMAREHGLDYAKASADRGDPVGVIALAVAYESGIAMKRDLQAADELYKRALPEVRRRADLGDPWWQNILGTLYSGGRAGFAKDDAQAAAWYQKAADRHYSTAQSNLSAILAIGRGGVAKDEAKALDLLRTAADQGNAFAIQRLGKYYEKGSAGLPVDCNHALELYRQAADQALPSAQATLAAVYEEGRCGVTKDEAKAAELFKEASSQGAPFASARLGNMYEDGRAGLAKDLQKATELYTQAAERGDSWSQNKLAGWYENGVSGITKDLPKAVALYREAADNGFAAAQSHLAEFYANGSGGLQRDDAKAVQLYRAAEEQNDDAGQYGLGTMYENGRGGLPSDAAKAVELFRKAADQNHAPALAALGFAYSSGEGGLTKDGVKAVELLRKAADQNDATAEHALGYRYANGDDGLPKDDVKAVGFYRKAADHGNAAAQNNLGVMYAQGRGGLPVDDAKAAELYALAADQGNAVAQNNLGSIYEEGRGGIPKDIDKALELYRKAAERGNDKAKTNVARLAK